MKDEKKVLSIKVSASTIDQLKKICEKEKRSQARQIEFLIENYYKELKKQ